MGRKAKTPYSPLRIPPQVLKVWIFAGMSALTFSLGLERRMAVWSLVLAVLPSLLLFKIDLLKRKEVQVLLCFFLLHLAGMLYTSHVSEGWLDVQQKSAFLLFPLLIPALSLFSEKMKSGLLWFYLAGLSVAAILSWMMALNHFWEESYYRSHQMAIYDAPYTNYFFSSRLSRFMHPGYFASQLIFGIWLLNRQTKGSAIPVSFRISVFFLQLFLFVTALCMLSKASLLLLPVLFFLGNFSRQIPVLSRRNLTWMIASMSLFSAVLWLIPGVKQSFFHAAEVWQHPERIQSSSADESSELRILAWKTALDIFSGHPLFGVGTGDVNPELWQAYSDQGFLVPAEKHLNAHSQYLQTAVALGIPGLLCLLCLPLMALINGVRQGNAMWLALSLLLLWLPVTECWFEQQQGMFFLLFWWVFVASESRMVGEHTAIKKNISGSL